MQRFFRALKLTVAMAVLASCGGGGGSLDNELALRVINASPDAPPINFVVDDVSWFLLDYKSGTRFAYLTPASREMGLEVSLPGDDVLIEESRALLAGREYTTIAVGKLAEDGSSTLQMLHVDNPVSRVPVGTTRLQFVHGAPDAAAIDVYLTGLTASLDAATPSYSLSGFRQISAQQDFVSGDSGTWRIRVTPAGDKATLLFDSGAITLSSAANLLFVVVTNTGAGTAPISLVANNGSSNAEVLDVATPAAVRVYNVSPDLPVLTATAERALRKDTVPPDPPLPSPCIYDPTLASTDVLCVAPPPEVTTLVPALGYPAAGSRTTLDFSIPPPAGYLFLNPENFFTFKVAASTAPETILFGTNLSLVKGGRNSLLALGLVPQPSGGTVVARGLTVLADEIRPFSRVTRLRIVDASPAGGSVDVYIELQGTDIANENATLGGLALGSSTGHFGFEPGLYTVTFTTASTKTVLASANFNAPSGSVFTVVLLDF
ncbi:MAG: DUF4397 domain-containing protein, partial [Gammaproteobacteria bacterium]|nr:DUF4397 domain-containing protein [Gammaproteobacteria bacterium]